MSSSFECPWCGHSNQEAWELELDDEETTETDCDHCGRPLALDDWSSKERCRG